MSYVRPLPFRTTSLTSLTSVSPLPTSEELCLARPVYAAQASSLPDLGSHYCSSVGVKLLGRQTWDARDLLFAREGEDCCRRCGRRNCECR